MRATCLLLRRASPGGDTKMMCRPCQTPRPSSTAPQSSLTTAGNMTHHTSPMTTLSVCLPLLYQHTSHIHLRQVRTCSCTDAAGNLDVTSMTNIGNGDSRLWVHLLSTWVISLYLWRVSQHFAPTEPYSQKRDIEGGYHSLLCL